MTLGGASCEITEIGFDYVLCETPEGEGNNLDIVVTVADQSVHPSPSHIRQQLQHHCRVFETAHAA